MSDSTLHDCIIIGAGLSGLVTAVRLQAAGIRPILLEARNRIGGRIFTDRSDGAPLDLGPAWWWAHQPNIQRLMHELDVQGFAQFEQGLGVYDDAVNGRVQYFRNPPAPKSYRFVGGTAMLIDRLASKLDNGQILLETAVTALTQTADGIVLTTNRDTFQAKHVVATLPPKLVAQSLAFEPPLPNDLLTVMQNTMTWMGQAMKVGLRYESAFWREKGLSGLTVSHTGPVAQFYDHGSAENNPALFGWVGDHSPSRALSLADRRTAIIEQAVRLFGPEAANPLDYAECNWAQEPFTTHPDSGMVSATGHPQYGHPLLQAAQFDGRLHWATTEASSVNGGYLDGAIVIGEKIATRLRDLLAVR